MPQAVDLELCRAAAKLSGLQAAVLRAVVYRLFQFAADSGAAQAIGIEEFAVLLDAEPRSVYRAVAELRRRGHLVVEGGGGAGIKSRYRLGQTLTSRSPFPHGNPDEPVTEIPDRDDAEP